MNILMLYPKFPETFWSFKHAIEFISKKASVPPLGLVTIAAMLPKNWNKRLVDLNIQALRQSDIDWADLVFISAMSVQRASVVDVVHRCKGSGKTIVAGGPLFTGEYDQFDDVDYFVLNEGEITLPPFLADYANGQAKRVYATAEYADMQTTPLPDWSLLKFSAYESMAIQFSRGCPYDCDFCNVTALLGHRPRTKTAVQLIAELDALYQLGWRRNIFMVDDNFIGNKKVLKQEILPALIEWRQGKTGCQFITEASINLSDDPELMDLLVKAGFISVFIGIETPEEASLNECNKKQNQHRNLLDSVHRMQKAGLQVMAGFIVGFDNDNPGTFQRQIDFIQQSGIVTAMVGLLQAPFGTRLYNRMEQEGRLIREMSGDNTDGTSNIVPRLDVDILQRGYRNVIQSIYSSKMFYERVKTFLTHYQPVKSPVSLHINEVQAFFRSIWRIGILGPSRKYYWNLFFWTLTHYPKKFALAITMTIYGYHFQKISAKAVTRTIHQPISQPA